MLVNAAFIRRAYSSLLSDCPTPADKADLWLYVERVHLQGVALDEFPAGFDHIPHEQGENLIRLNGVLHLDLQERPLVGLGFMVVSQSWSGFISPRPL